MQLITLSASIPQDTVLVDWFIKGYQLQLMRETDAWIHADADSQEFNHSFVCGYDPAAQLHGMAPVVLRGHRKALDSAKQAIQRVIQDLEKELTQLR